MTASPASLLSQLRAATAPAHRQLDGALGLREGSITRTRYVNFLRGSLIALEPLEARLRPWAAGEGPARSELLRADLVELGASPSVDEAADVPALESAAAAFGARYVIEGSALGGAVLSRSIDAALDLQGRATRYLTIYGEGLAEHWRDFLSNLAAFDANATPLMRLAACDAALAVFNLYAASFRSSGAIAAPS